MPLLYARQVDRDSHITDVEARFDGMTMSSLLESVVTRRGGRELPPFAQFPDDDGLDNDDLTDDDEEESSFDARRSSFRGERRAPRGRYRRRG